MREIKLRLDEQVIAELDTEAAIHNVSRADLIRQRIEATAPAAKAGLDATGYNQLVRDAYAFMGGGIDRRQFEGLVAFLFNKICAAKA